MSESVAPVAACADPLQRSQTTPSRSINTSSVFHLSAVIPCPSQGITAVPGSGGWIHVSGGRGDQRPDATELSRWLLKDKGHRPRPGPVCWRGGSVSGGWLGPQCLVISMGTWTFSQVIGFPGRAVIFCRRSNDTKVSTKARSETKTTILPLLYHCATLERETARMTRHLHPERVLSLPSSFLACRVELFSVVKWRRGWWIWTPSAVVCVCVIFALFGAQLLVVLGGSSSW